MGTTLKSLKSRFIRPSYLQESSMSSVLALAQMARQAHCHREGVELAGGSH
jgi:hypothetical protein